MINAYAKAFIILSCEAHLSLYHLFCEVHLSFFYRAKRKIFAVFNNNVYLVASFRKMLKLTNMEKEKLELEYQLKSTSISVLWNMISTSHGLSEWFSETVHVTDEKYVFVWRDHEEPAYLLNMKPLDYISFQWERDKNTDYYFELRIVKHELAGGLSILVTEFAAPEDREDEIRLWNKLITDLRRKLGV